MPIRADLLRRLARPHPHKGENMKKVFRGTVSKGQLVMGSDYTDHLFTLEEQDIDLTVEKHRTIRSVNQNAYYWGVVLKILCRGQKGEGGLGYREEEMHEILRGKFLREAVRIGDDLIHYAKSTASLNTTEFEEYLTEIREWASVELTCCIPLPNEIDF